ncbi:MAG: hypothetical protein AAGB93_12955 [Planctomycetota bacterium]
MNALLGSAREAPVRAALVAATLGVGLLLVVDGALRGEPRHRIFAAALGIGICLPPIAVLLGGPRTRRAVERLALSFATLAVLLVATEGVIRVLELRAFLPGEVQRDPVLGHAWAPGRDSNDAWGFNNDAVPGSADVVCVGDSQTVGTNVPRSQNYPSRLARAAGVPVYNMSCGGYGPIQYSVLTERAMELRPRALVVGLYLGNDVADAHRFLGLERWADLRDPELEYVRPADVSYEDGRSLNLAMALVDGLMERSWLARAVGARVKQAVRMSRFARSLQVEAGGEGFEDPSIGTRFTSAYRAGMLDERTAHVRDGLRMTEVMLERIAATCREHGVEPLVLVIHNKEWYYAPVLEARGVEPSRAHARLVELEDRMTARLVGLAESAGLRVLDPHERLVAALLDGTAIYPPDVDAHVNAAGCALLAEALAEALADIGRR